MLIFLEALIKHKWLIVLAPLVAIVVAALIAFLRPAMYEAEASLLVKLGREYLYAPEVGDGGTRAPNQLAGFVNAELQILDSPDLKARVVDEIGPATLYPDVADEPTASELAVAKLDADLLIANIADANVLQIAFRHEDAAMAARVINLLIDRFLEKRTHIYATLEPAFLEERLADSAERLNTAHTSLKDFRQNNRLYAYEQQAHLLLDERQQLQRTLDTVSAKASGLDRKAATLALEMLRVPETVTVYQDTTRNPAVDEALEEFIKRKIEAQQLAKEYGERHPALVSARTDLVTLEAFIEQQDKELQATVRTGQNPIRSNLEAQLIQAKTELGLLQTEQTSLEQQSARVDDDLSAIAAHKKQLDDLERTVQLYEGEHAGYLDKMGEVRFSEALNQDKQSNIRIIQEATPPLGAKGLALKAQLLLAGIIGSFLALGAAYAMESLRPTFSTPELVERRLGTVVLASFPERNLASGRAALPGPAQRHRTALGDAKPPSASLTRDRKDRSRSLVPDTKRGFGHGGESDA